MPDIASEDFDTQPLTFSPKFERRMKRFFKAHRNKVSFAIYVACHNLLCFLKRLTR